MTTVSEQEREKARKLRSRLIAEGIIPPLETLADILDEELAQALADHREAALREAAAAVHSLDLIALAREAVT